MGARNMTWNAKLTLAFCAAGAAMLASVILAKMLWAFGGGFACGVLLCAFFPAVDGGVRAILGKLAGFVAGVRARAPNIPIRARESYAKPVETAAFVAPASKPRKLLQIARGIANIIGFVLRHPVPIVILSLFLLGFGLLRGCALPHIGESREHAQMRAELAQAEAETQAALRARDLAVAQVAQQAAVYRQRITMLAAQGRSEIEAARPTDEIPIDPGVERAWRAAIERLRADAGPDPDSPSPGGSGT